MTDPVSMVLASLKAATDIAGAVRQAKVAYEQTELRLKFTDLVSALTDAKMEMAAVQDAIREKDQEILRLKEAAAVRAEVKFVHNAYWRGEPKQDGDGPYCPRCFDVDGRLARMQDRDYSGYTCPACHTNARMPWTPPPPTIRRG